MSMMNPRYMLLEAGATSPQWFDDGAKLMERVRAITSCAAAPKTSHCGMPPSLWVDIESRGATDEVRRVLSELPLCDESAIPASVRTTLVDCGDIDAVELQPITGSYVRGTLKCLTQHRSVPSAPAELFVCAGADEQSELHGGHSDAMHKHDSSSAHGDTSLQPEAIGSTEMEETMCSFLVTRRVAVTVHTTSFLGLKELLWTMTHTAVSAAAATAQEAATQSNNSCTFMWFTSVVLSRFVAAVCETMMPELALAINEIDSIDEISLLINPGSTDHDDMLRRIGILRRRMAILRTRLHWKETFLHDILRTHLRESFICAEETKTVMVYEDVFERMSFVARRLDDIRNFLNQANLNYVSGVSMRMNQSSIKLEYTMTLFSKMSAIIFPLQYLMATLGMNINIPLQADYHPTLVPFFCLCAFCVLWAIICVLPSTKKILTGFQATSFLSSV